CLAVSDTVLTQSGFQLPRLHIDEHRVIRRRTPECLQPNFEGPSSHLFLDAGEPVDDDGNRRPRGRISRHGVNEKASVRGDVEGHEAGDVRVEEWHRYARLEGRST